MSLGVVAELSLKLTVRKRVGEEVRFKGFSKPPAGGAASWRGVAESPWVLLQPHAETPTGNFG